MNKQNHIKYILCFFVFRRMYTSAKNKLSINIIIISYGRQFSMFFDIATHKSPTQNSASFITDCSRLTVSSIPSISNEYYTNEPFIGSWYSVISNLSNGAIFSIFLDVTLKKQNLFPIGSI